MARQPAGSDPTTPITIDARARPAWWPADRLASVAAGAAATVRTVGRRHGRGTSAWWADVRPG
ncbi:Protein of unknown function [Micromonospora lupini str. Lupac 08]|uniref:Uncharacterized protein n=1 Tax=Micromonospora lupini str. Lupac 08 TaxID=1150864 RepID=I0KW87_9ACTN|nr:Protein of unknown function [Micromonospora lupini str. Lupac 08]